ncbi:MAG: T9SS type A sorting domain-containing protein [Bacteroidetes bacterium]|nr:T9SS type A sorting domain-containing protein [Bacteroidota bacterium]
MQPSFLLPLPFILLTAPLLAQPTMTAADAPHIGQAYTFVIGNYMLITASGENVTWDLTDAGDGGTLGVTMVDPSSTSAGALFLDADLAWVSPGQVDFMRIDADGLYANGAYLPASDIVVHYTDEYISLPYPCTYNTAFTDPYVSVYEVQGQPVTSNGVETFAADGYGDLVLPWGTVHNVLKVKVTTDAHDLFNGSDYHSVVSNVFFYRPGLSIYLLNATDFTLSVDDVPVQQTQALNYLSEASVGVEDAKWQEIGVDVFPVPAHDRLSVVFGLAGARSGAIDLFDATGQAVRSVAIGTRVAGIQRADMDVSGLAAGVYLLRVTDDHGQRGTRQVVLE